MKEKKEIKVKKSFLNLIFKSIGLAICTVLIILHFGKTFRTGSFNVDQWGSRSLEYSDNCRYESPFENFNYTFETDCDMSYPEKLIAFYLPQTFTSHLHYILVGSIMYGLIIYFFQKFKFKLD